MFSGQQLFLMSRMLEMSLQAARCEFVLFVFLFFFFGRGRVVEHAPGPS